MIVHRTLGRESGCVNPGSTRNHNLANRTNGDLTSSLKTGPLKTRGFRATMTLGGLNAQRPEQGFGKLFKRLRRLGHGWNHKRVYRIYCSLKPNKKRKGKRRLPTRCPSPLVVPEAINECWSADFMSDLPRPKGQRDSPVWCVSNPPPCPGGVG